jgi:hypothetical protein
MTKIPKYGYVSFSDDEPKINTLNEYKSWTGGINTLNRYKPPVEFNTCYTV